VSGAEDEAAGREQCHHSIEDHEPASIRGIHQAALLSEFSMVQPSRRFAPETGAGPHYRLSRHWFHGDPNA
jgi:hypothetical protein